jgi:hypothetical protein
MFRKENANKMDVLVERLSKLEQEQEMEAREFQLVVLQVRELQLVVLQVWSSSWSSNR